MVTKQVTAIHYETVPRDTGMGVVFVTIPVETVTNIEETVYRLVPEEQERQYSVLVPVQQEAFVHTLDIRVLNGTEANQLIISTIPNGGSGRLVVDTITVQGALGVLRAPTTSVGSLQADRFIGDLRLTELRGPMTTGGSRLRQTSIAIGRINGDITTGTSIASFKSNQVGKYTITAPRIASLLIHGDFNADLMLDTYSQSTIVMGSASIAGGVNLRSTIALGSASIAGGINSATWDIRGSVGQVIVKQAIQGWNFGSENRLWNIESIRAGQVHAASIWAGGTIKSLTATSWDGFDIWAQTIGTIQVTGSFSTYLSLDAGLSTARALGSATLGSVAGTWDIRGSVGPINVKGIVDGWNLGNDFAAHSGQLGRIDSLQLGQVKNLSIFANGRIAALSAFLAASADSRIHARTIGTLNVTGDFTGMLELDAGDESALAIETAHLTRVHDSFWDIRGSLGDITVDGSATNWGLGGNDRLGNIRKVKIGGTLHGSGIQAVGRIGSLQAAQWQITDVSARSLGSLTVTGGKPGGLPGDFLFSTVTLTGASKHIGLGTANILGRVYGSTFNVMAGDVTTFTCGRFEHSRLFVGYVPVDPENFSLTGNFVDAFTLGTFTTTAMPLVPGQSDPRTDAFTGSQIVANRFGRINLTSVGIQNGGTSFGLRVNGAANAGKVRINTAPFNPNVDVQPGTTKVDFQFLTS